MENVFASELLHSVYTLLNNEYTKKMNINTDKLKL